MLLLLACVTPDSDSGAQSFLADGVYEPDCAPWDGAATTFTLGQLACGANIDGMRVILTTYDATSQLVTGYHQEIGENMVGRAGTDPAAMDEAVSGTLDVTAVEGERLTVAWSITTDAGASYAGTGQVVLCDNDIVCG